MEVPSRRPPGHVLTSIALLLVVAARPSPAQQAGAIAGEVVEAGSRRPIAGAQVFAQGTALGAITDEAGRFVIPNVQPGRIALRAEMTGYRTGEQRVDVPAGASAVADFALVAEIFQLDEVVVTGTAGSARQREVAHAIEEVVVDQIVEPVPTVDDLLESRVPGLSVRPSCRVAGKRGASSPPSPDGSAGGCARRVNPSLPRDQARGSPAAVRRGKA